MGESAPGVHRTLANPAVVADILVKVHRKLASRAVVADSLVGVEEVVGNSQTEAVAVRTAAGRIVRPEALLSKPDIAAAAERSAIDSQHHASLKCGVLGVDQLTYGGLPGWLGYAAVAPAPAAAIFDASCLRESQCSEVTEPADDRGGLVFLHPWRWKSSVLWFRLCR